MNISLEIKNISSSETYPIRHEVLRAGHPIESCKFDGDEQTETIHFGAFKNNKLVGVISCYLTNGNHFNSGRNYQIRGVAVASHLQQAGVGKALMLHAEKNLKKINCNTIWLNARTNVNLFYTKLDYTEIGTTFEVPLIGSHQCFFKKINL
tara:strand:+ start:1215 stop:1667 length:453 start_codon:yes stop_codon:yes gene_type:complete